MGCFHSKPQHENVNHTSSQDEAIINPCHHEGTSFDSFPSVTTPTSSPAVTSPSHSSSPTSSMIEIIEYKIRRKSKILFGESTESPDNIAAGLQSGGGGSSGGGLVGSSSSNSPTSPTSSSSSSASANGMTQNISAGSLQCRPDDFIINNFLAKGGMGAVYCGIRKSDSCKVALKFFGYDEKCPDMDSIQLEVTSLSALRGLDGVVPVLGIFADTPNGILGKKAYKIWPKSYPVLVMPLLEGGALIDRIHVRTSVCENDLKHWFKQFIIGLGNIHSKGYLHRDLKLENIMLESMADDSPVRIIDFGLVVKLNGDVLTSHKISGTRGYHAPESLKWKQYSTKTDIWQSGVCLYSMLSGFLPFHPDNDVQTIDAKYFPMTGPAWIGISDRAKDLISRILVADPEKRITIQEILTHPWITSDAPQVELGVEYVARIKHLALRQKMRGFFLQNGIDETNKLRRGHLAELLPFLNPNARTKRTSYVSINSDTPSKFKIGRTNSSSSLYKGSEHGMSYSSHGGHNSPCKVSIQERSVTEFKNKLHIFQELVIESFREKYHHANNHKANHSYTYSLGGSSSIRHPHLCLDYDEFVECLSKAGLSHLAERTVFSIFDITNSGVIDLKEFLFTMLAFQPEEETLPNQDDPTSTDMDLQTIRMFFHLFDINGTGSIQLDDFKLAVSCLLENRHSSQTLSVYSYPSQDMNDIFVTSSGSTSSHGFVPFPTSTANVENIEELFRVIDTDKNGRIGFGEFKEFYETLLATTSQNGVLGPLT